MEDKRQGRTRRRAEPAHPKLEHQKDLISEEKQRKKSLKVEHEWFQVTNGKVLKCYAKLNGNVYKEYVDKEDRCKELLTKAKKENKLGDPRNV